MYLRNYPQCFKQWVTDDDEKYTVFIKGFKVDYEYFDELCRLDRPSRVVREYCERSTQNTLAVIQVRYGLGEEKYDATKKAVRQIIDENTLTAVSSHLDECIHNYQNKKREACH